MENKNYYLAEVLCGLIKAYRENEKQLEELNKLLMYNGNKLSSYYLDTKMSYGDLKPELVCRYEEINSKLKQLLINIQKVLKIYYYPINCDYCLTDNNGRYYIKSEHNLYIPNKNQKIFADKAQTLLNGEFANKINFDKKLEITPENSMWINIFHNFFRMDFYHQMSDIEL